MPGPTPSHSGRWMVLIDAAKGSATSPPDLSKYKADFVVVSFYKLFGYPTGIGALIARNGTVAASIADVDFYKRRDGIEEYFEDGTLAFVSIAALRHGFKILNALTISAISRHTTSLALYVRKALLNLRHVNGSRVCTLYGVNDPEAGHVCWDDRDVLNGKPTGSVRVSFGYMSTFEDARFAVSRHGLLHDREWLLKSLSGEILTQKKLRTTSVSSSSTNSFPAPAQVPEMGFITTLVDLKLGRLIVGSPRCKEKLQIELTGQCIAEREVMEIYSQRYEVQGYGNEVDTWFSNAVGRPCTLVRSYAFQNHMCSNKNRNMGMCRDLEARLNFVNEAQFLLISEESIADLNNRLRSKLHNGSNERPIEVDPSRFRPNLVVSGGKPYAEDGWRSLKIAETNFTSLGGCNRCQMINMTFTAATVQRSNEPLATLASYRRLKVCNFDETGKIYFGVLLKMCDSIKQEAAWLRAGQEILANAE
ncbi:UNVERIFIED_CONTAM: Molybdenum cofactor sulfurase [Sesamum radiatum]|uniref:Molybdenum cofactor sulfurase n=1 Tax=Sesamum radiatum TaxID=300843 RepID=A0AAW2T2X0_SESRA